MSKHYSESIPKEDRDLIVEGLQRLFKQRMDVINTINDDKVDLTIETFALGAEKIKDMLRDFGATTGK